MAYEMNEIEQKFYDGYQEFYDEPDIKPQEYIGVYRADFVCNDKYVVEIDGQDFHSSKEQREYDYQREREIMKQGYIIVRFTASEVCKDPMKCVKDFNHIVHTFDRSYEYGFRSPKGEPKLIGDGILNFIGQIFYRAAIQKGCPHCAEFVLFCCRNIHSKWGE